MTKSYRIAIIGIGAIADVHALAIGDLDNLELVAACCRGEEKRQEVRCQIRLLLVCGLRADARQNRARPGDHRDA